MTRIELVNVCKRFNAGDPNEFTAVDNVTLTIAGERITVLKGPSGSGKTTLLALIGAMSRPTSGRIRLKGMPFPFLPSDAPEEGLELSSLPERFLTRVRRSTFGFIFQQFNLIPGISALENVMLPAFPTGAPHAAVRERAHELLGAFGISRQAAIPVGRLSGGELQRVAIARALINNPPVIIADEPTAHLDSRLSRDFLELIGGLAARGATLLMASHDPIVFDSPLVSRVVEMRDGRIDAGEAGP
jgi:putative ABC transport system ATP-binding protein